MSPGEGILPERKTGMKEAKELAYLEL